MNSSLLSSSSTDQQGMLDRIMHPNSKLKSSYEEKGFQSGENFSGRAMKTKEYAGIKNFNSKPFETKVFEGARQSWMSKMLFPEKKLPKNLQGVNGDASRQFTSKELPIKNYANLNKKSSYGNKEGFTTRGFSLKGKTQGAIDNDPGLQAAIKKGLSIDDVRKLLNKVP
jgi:hypothetical protein